LRPVELSFLISAVALFFISTDAAAYYCSEPSEPSIPGGYYAESYEMESARGEVEAYLDDVQDYKRCLAVRIEEANSDAEDVIDEWDSAVRQYNDS